MNVKKLWMPAAVLVGAGFGAFLLLVTAPEVEHVSAEKALPVIRTINVQPGDVHMIVRSQGTVAPRTESDLVPEVSGTIVWVSPSLASGGFFSKGDALLRIDDRDHRASLARARADVARARGEAEHAAAELRRQRGLARSNATSPSQLSNVRRGQRVAQASLEAAEVSFEQAERDLARCEITAPFDGRVRSEHVDVGQFVSRGMPTATLYATDFAEIRLPLADKQLAFLELPGMQNHATAEAKLEGPAVLLHATFAGRENTWHGRVVRTEGEIDAQSRMVHVVARVEDPYGTARSRDHAGPSDAETEALAAAVASDGLVAEADTAGVPLAVGLFVRAEIEGREVENVLIVPRLAMRDNDRLLLVDRDDRLHLRSVDVLRIDRDEVVIRTQLDAGDRVVVSPIQVVVDGMKVRPIADQPIGSGEAARS